MTILMAIIVPILYLLREFKIQSWRKKGADTKTVVSASSIFALPVFAITLFYILLSNQSFTFDSSWLFYSGVWIITCFVTNLMSYYIIKNISVTQFGIFTKVASILFSVIADIFVFHLTFPVISIIALSLMFLGGISIDKYEEKNIKKETIKKGLIYVILLIFLIRFIDIFQTASFKQLAIIQSNPLFFVAFLQTALFIPLSFIGLKGVKKAVREKLITVKDMIYLAFLIIIICFAEPYIYKALPLTVLTTLGLLRIGISYVYDVKADNLKINKKSLIALAMIIAGSLLLIFVY